MAVSIVVPLLSVGAFNTLRFVLITLVLQPLIEIAISALYEKVAGIHLLCSGTLRWRVARYGPLALHGSYYSRKSRILLYLTALSVLIFVLLVEFDSGAESFPVHEPRRSVSTMDMHEFRWNKLPPKSATNVTIEVDHGLTDRALRVASRVSSLILTRGGDVSVDPKKLGLVWRTPRDKRVNMRAVKELIPESEFLEMNALLGFRGKAVVETTYHELFVEVPSRSISNKHTAPTIKTEHADVFIGQWIPRAGNANLSFHGHQNVFSRIALAEKYGGSVVLVKLSPAEPQTTVSTAPRSVREADGISCMARAHGFPGSPYACIIQEKIEGTNNCSRDLILGHGVDKDGGSLEQWVALTRLFYSADNTTCLSDVGAYWAHVIHLSRWDMEMLPEDDDGLGCSTGIHLDTSSTVEMMAEVFSMSVSQNMVFVNDEDWTEMEVRQDTKPTIGIWFVIGVIGLIVFCVILPVLGLTPVGGYLLRAVFQFRHGIKVPGDIKVSSTTKFIEGLVSDIMKGEHGWDSLNGSRGKAGIILARNGNGYRVEFGFADEAVKYVEEGGESNQKL